ncbi:MAG: beta-xylosidase [Myxococcales bacterium]|nr:MAG: beta-xylosidase [Myxococcales bacterium]
MSFESGRTLVRRSSSWALLTLCASLLGCGSSGAEPGGGAGGSSAGGAGAQGGSSTTTAGSGGGGANAAAGTAGASGSVSSGGGGGSSSTGGGGSGASFGGGGSGGSPDAAGAPVIENDRFWRDTAGNPIYSQGGGVLQVGDTFYWYGVKYGGAVTYAAKPVGKNGDTSFQGITTYSSKDLVHWKLEATDKPANTGGWFGRLGVAYHASTKKYVLAAQGGGGLYFATSDRPSGGFVYDHVQTNLPGIVNGSTGDQTIFQDEDGQAYLISSSSMGRSNRYVSPLRATDFLAAEEAWFVYKGGGREGNCLFKQAGTYYHCSSDLHGWNTSQTYCVSATSLKGPWSAEFVLAGTEADYSHVTQTGFFIQVQGTEQSLVIFAGDRWADFAGNGLGYNQWMPLSVEGGKPRFHSLSAWSLDAKKGTWSVAPTNNWTLNPTFEADRVSVTVPVGWQATQGANSKDARTGNWAWQLATAGSLSQAAEGLPNGTYTLSVWAKSTAEGGKLSMEEHGGAAATKPIPAGNGWTEVKLQGVAVTTGRAVLSVTSGGAAVTVDDFSLVAD